MNRMVFRTRIESDLNVTSHLVCLGNICVSGDCHRSDSDPAVLVPRVLQLSGAGTDKSQEHQLIQLRLVQRIRPSTCQIPTTEREQMFQVQCKLNSSDNF